MSTFKWWASLLAAALVISVLLILVWVGAVTLLSEWFG